MPICSPGTMLTATVSSGADDRFRCMCLPCRIKGQSSGYLGGLILTAWMSGACGSMQVQRDCRREGEMFCLCFVQETSPIFILYPALHIIWLSLVIALYVYQHESA